MSPRLAILLPLAALGLALAPSAMAQSKPITGAWRFETAPINLNCKLSGDMTIAKDAKTGAFSCTFVAVQSCTGDPPIEIHVRQTCSATRAGDKVTMVSKIDKVVSVKPVEMTAGALRNYAPDDFAVTLNKAGTEMTGMFHSLSDAMVRFWRPNGDLVS